MLLYNTKLCKQSKLTKHIGQNIMKIMLNSYVVQEVATRQGCIAVVAGRIVHSPGVVDHEVVARRTVEGLVLYLGPEK